LVKRNIFSFLWKGNHVKEKVTLVKWEKLSRPKKERGWGLKNIFHFSKALATKILWNVTVGSRLWKDVLVQKYLHLVSDILD
jgi:hypothetical protein